MELSANTRSISERNHALVAPDGLVNSSIPGWMGCVVNVIIDQSMGAQFTQTMITASENCELIGHTKESQIFFYLVNGKAKVTIDNKHHSIANGHFAYVPINKEYQFTEISPGSQFITFHKVYEPIENHPTPSILFGDASAIKSQSFLNDDALQLQVLLPDQLAFDIAVNIFTYEPGGHLPFVETHVMEHGLTFLQGQGIYRLADKWYPVQKGDHIWMAPYCQQWFTAMGKEKAVYIYYKNVNRFPGRI
ncbi:MAG TPA: (S)-ureidoglycine aminohydrolase [Cyclobacteriaceae bacterium]